MALLLSWRLWAALGLAAVLAFSHFSAYRSGRHAVQSRWDEANVKQERLSQEQTTRNRDLQRAAELRYVVKGETRDRFFTNTIKEIVHDAAPLAACVLPESVRLRLNDANRCARSDSPASCGAAGEVPSP